MAPVSCSNSAVHDSFFKHHLLLCWCSGLGLECIVCVSVWWNSSCSLRLISNPIFSLRPSLLPTIGYDISLWPLEHLSLSGGIFIILLGSCSLFEFSLLHDWMSLMAQTGYCTEPRESCALCNKRLMPKTNLPGHASLCLLSFLLPEDFVGCHPSQKVAQGSKSLSVKGILSDTKVLELLVTGKVSLNILSNNPRHHFIRPSLFTVFINPREFPCLKSQLGFAYWSLRPSGSTVLSM